MGKLEKIQGRKSHGSRARGVESTICEFGQNDPNNPMPFLRLQTIALFAHTDFGLSGRRRRVLREAAARTDVLFSMLTCSPPALGAPAAASAPCTHTADAFGRQHEKCPTISVKADCGLVQ